MRAVAIAIALAGCASLRDGPSTTDGNAGAGDAPTSCQVTINFMPSNPQVGDHVHAAAVITNLGQVPTFSWTLDGSASTAYEAFDDSAIGFDVPTATTHFVTVDLTGISTSCPQGQGQIVVTASGPSTLYRMRVVPPAGVAAPFEGDILVHAGTPAPRDVQLDSGMELDGTVTNGAMGVPAYVQLVPASGPTVDTFSALATGAFATRVALATYQVIVIPEMSGLAPRAFTWSPSSSSTFAVDAGSAISGTVTAPGGGPLAGATVQLTSGNLPSTMATTLGDGSFTVHATFAANAQVTATVVPPAASGLARLTATSAFDLTNSLAITYNAATPCDLGGVAVQRAGVAKAGAQVTIVGSFSTPHTIGGVIATGSVVATAMTNGSGVLPSLPVPRELGLSAVVQVAPGDLAVASLDTSACSVPTIVAPAQLAKTGVVFSNLGAPLAGVQLEATPTGALALATLAPVDGVTGSDGSVTVALASGASYAVRVSDPQARGAPLSALTVPAQMTLGSALAVSGTVTVTGGTNVVPGAAVELLCGSCTGIDADRPIAQAATDVQGHYVLAVPDPGSM